MYDDMLEYDIGYPFQCVCGAWGIWDNGMKCDICGRHYVPKPKEYLARRAKLCQDWLSRINDPGLIECRGTVYTPYGWRNVPKDSPPDGDSEDYPDFGEHDWAKPDCMMY